jgi:hypothetical protein
MELSRWGVGNCAVTAGAGAVLPTIWSGDGGRKPIELRGSGGVNWASSGISRRTGATTNGAVSLTTPLSRLANCSASRRSRGSGTAAWASSMSRVPSSGRTGSDALMRARSTASGVRPSKAVVPVTASKMMSASA